VTKLQHGQGEPPDMAQQRDALELLVQERTAQLEAALALAEQRRLEAERANAAKSRFLAHMSHEIRTPLNGVLGLTELALRGATSTDQRRYLTVAHQSGQALLRVINEVLDFSRIEAGRLDLRPQALDLAELLADALRAVMPLARQRDLVLMYDWTGDSALVLGNDTGIRQVITNLLGNAIKFTPQGQVSLSTEARRDGPAHLALAIQVRDSGPGIPQHMLGRVFEPFEQGDDSLARDHGGTGLGLAIAHRLAAAMGGTLQVACPAEGGSIFTLALRLPLVKTDTETPAPDTAQAAGRLAWLVYHQEAPALWLARRLERLGWQVIPCVGLQQALGRALDPGEPRPDLVLLAEPALSPGIDLQPLRSALPSTRMHLLIRSDWHDPALEQQANALGLSSLVAPLTPSCLLGLGRNLDAPPASITGSDGSAKPFTDAILPLRAGASVLLVEDNPVNQMVGKAFLQALGLQVRVADGGSEALASCQDDPPDLVLMDLQMPGMDGLEATRRLLALQREGRWPGAPIVALTAHASDTDRSACLAAGMLGVLTKPLSLDRLQRQLLPWLAA
jgi:signal transduction histidine kinase/CheY-like chemotaxis protein